MDVSIYTAVTDDGVEAHVFESAHRNGYPFVVRILDADAGQWVGGDEFEGMHFQVLDDAQAYADRCAR